MIHMYHIIRLHFLLDWHFLQVDIFIFIGFAVVLVYDGPQGQGHSTDLSIPPNAKKGYLPSDDFLAGPEPSSYTPWSFLKGNSLDQGPPVCAKSTRVWALHNASATNNSPSR